MDFLRTQSHHLFLGPVPFIRLFSARHSLLLVAISLTYSYHSQNQPLILLYLFDHFLEWATNHLTIGIGTSQITSIFCLISVLAELWHFTPRTLWSSCGRGQLILFSLPHSTQYLLMNYAQHPPQNRALVRPAGLESGHCHLFNVESWASWYISSSIIFFNCKMKVVVISIVKHFHEY